MLFRAVDGKNRSVSRYGFCWDKACGGICFCGRHRASRCEPSHSVVVISAADADVLSEPPDGDPSDSAVAISAVDADVHSVGKQRAAIPASAVVTGAASEDTAALHVAGSRPASKRKRAHAAGSLNKARKIDLFAYFKRAESST